MIDFLPPNHVEFLSVREVLIALSNVQCFWFIDSVPLRHWEIAALAMLHAANPRESIYRIVLLAKYLKLRKPLLTIFYTPLEKAAVNILYLGMFTAYGVHVVETLTSNEFHFILNQWPFHPACPVYTQQYYANLHLMEPMGVVNNFFPHLGLSRPEMRPFILAEVSDITSHMLAHHRTSLLNNETLYGATRIVLYGFGFHRSL